MRNLLLFGVLLSAVIALQSFTHQPFEAYPDGEEKLTKVDINVNGIYRDSLFWFMDITIRGQGLAGEMVTTKTKVKGQNKMLRGVDVRKGMKGAGQLDIPEKKGKGTLTITRLGKKSLSGVRVSVDGGAVSKFR